MVEHQSKEVVDKMSEELKIQPAVALPRNIVNNIQPTYEVNPVHYLTYLKKNANNATNATIHTCSTSKDTFLSAAFLNVQKDGSSTSTNSIIRATPVGKAATEMLQIRTTTLTAEIKEISVTVPIPIKLERGSVIEIVNASAVADIKTTGVAFFYETDPQ